MSVLRGFLKNVGWKLIQRWDPEEEPTGDLEFWEIAGGPPGKVGWERSKKLIAMIEKHVKIRGPVQENQNLRAGDKEWVCPECKKAYPSKLDSVVTAFRDGKEVEMCSRCSGMVQDDWSGPMQEAWIDGVKAASAGKPNESAKSRHPDKYDIGYKFQLELQKVKESRRLST